MTYAEQSMDEIYVILKEFSKEKQPFFSFQAAYILQKYLHRILEVVNNYVRFKQTLSNIKTSGDVACLTFETGVPTINNGGERK